MTGKKKTLSQDEMIKNVVRDYPINALEFFNPEILKKYGNVTQVDFLIQEAKKHSHYNNNMKNDLTILYTFQNGKKLVLTLLEHWSDKNKFDIHRFAHYLIDLDYQFPDYEKFPIALFTDSSHEWHKMPQQKIEITCLNEVFLTFKYRLIRMKSYEAEKFKDTKNKFIAVMRSAMKWDIQNKILLAVDFIKKYNILEKDIKTVIQNIDIIEYFLYINKTVKDKITELLEERRDTNMIVQEFLKRGEIKGLLKGKVEGKIEDAKKMHEKGFTIEDIMDITGLSKDELKEAGIGEEV